MTDLSQRLHDINTKWNQSFHSTNANAKAEAFAEMSAFADGLIKALAVEVHERDAAREEAESIMRASISSRVVARTVAETNKRLTAALSNIPKECTLLAMQVEGGWYLGVQQGDRPVAELAWPESWPKAVGDKELQSFGFIVA